MASEKVYEFAVHGLGLLRRVLNGVGGAMAQMVLQKSARDFAQGFVHGGDLNEDVCTIAIFFNHSLKSANLAFDAAEAIEIGSFDLGVHGDGVFTGADSSVLGFVHHEINIPPGGYMRKRLGYVVKSGNWPRIYWDFTQGGSATMTTVEVVFTYGAVPDEAVLRGMDDLREVYGIRRIRFNETEQSVRVEYDATRLNEESVASLLRRAGIDVTGKVALV